MPINRQIRTDLAAEQTSAMNGENGEIPGVSFTREDRNGFTVETVEIMTDAGARALCKPIGKYITVELDALIKRSENAFENAAQLMSELLRSLLPPSGGRCALVAGLGNPSITPDAIGPMAVESVMATRHLKTHMPEDFAAFASVSALKTGVLGTTGIESAELLKSVCDMLSPSRVVAVDALASASLDKLCRTVQLSDAGIVPGSGVGNDRAELCERTLGAPVIAVGVPTVVDASAFTDDPAAAGMFVTPRDIDASVKDTAKLIGYAIDLALHDGLTITDVDMFLS